MRLFLRLQELRNPIETRARRLLHVLLLRLDRLSADPGSKPLLLLSTLWRRGLARCIDVACWRSTNRRLKDDRSLETRCFSGRATRSLRFISLKRGACGWNGGLSTVGC